VQRGLAAQELVAQRHDGFVYIVPPLSNPIDEVANCSANANGPAVSRSDGMELLLFLDALKRQAGQQTSDRHK
jgi:hypothetical protein